MLTAGLWLCCGDSCWAPAHALQIVKVSLANLGVPNPRIYAIHAGLECGFFLDAFPNLECVSIGPTVTGAHSPDERLEIATVPRFFALVSASVKRLAHTTSL